MDMGIENIWKSPERPPGRGKHMRGFVITILSVGLILLLVTLAMSFRNAQLSTERALLEPLPLIYSAFLIDDIAGELNSILGPQISISEGNESIGLAISDTLHEYNHSPELTSYGEFLEGEVAGSTASNITANFTNLTGGMERVFINGDYVYSNNHTNRELIFTRDGGTGATAYEINFTVTAVRSNITFMEFDEGGTLNATIRYTDLNDTGGASVEGSIFPGTEHTMEIDYADGSSVVVEIGPERGNDGSLRIKSNGIDAVVSFYAALPPINETMKLGYEYDATVEYVQGKISKGCRIGK